VTAPLLSIAGLTTTFPAGGRRVPVVDDVELELTQGQVLALVGESGCGKSVTALSILRLVPKPGRVEGGEVRLLDRNLLKLSVPEMRSVRGHQISMIFQEPMTSLNPVATVGSQVVEAIRLHERTSAAAARARTLELFKQVGIPDAEQRLDAYPHQLSGGLKQRVMIAMALSTRPKLLIADEPTTALDVTIQAQILRLLRELKREFHTAILLITHDLGVVNELADHICVMYAGKIVERGTRHEILANPQHPYTQGLLRSMPARAVRGQRLHEIEGVVPPPASWPKGCRFCTRCPRAFEPCLEIVPQATVCSPTQLVHCHAVAADRQPEGKTG
jgi:peptide/nickel transport system ATP-binding protein